MCSVLKISKLNVSLNIQFFFFKRALKLSSFLQPAGWLSYVLCSSFQESEESERWIIQICSQVCNNGKKAWLEGFAEFLKPACDLTVTTSAHFPVYDWNILKKDWLLFLMQNKTKRPAVVLLMSPHHWAPHIWVRTFHVWLSHSRHV